MKLRPLSRQEVRALDHRAINEFGISGLVLMENAGHGAARWLAEQCPDGPILICCGKGNNGGDGYVMARHLDAWGYSVQVLTTAEPTEPGDARANYEIIERSGIPHTRWDPATDLPGIAQLFLRAAWIVDGLLGTGASGPVREPLFSAIAEINAAPAKRFAIDIPSGLDCDHGQALGIAVRADLTATFVAPKLGFANPEAVPFTGVVKVLDIGLPACLLKEYAN